MRNDIRYILKEFRYPLTVAVIFFAFLFFVGCTDENGATRTLRNNGFTNIEITGWSPFSCSEEDVFRTGFEATSPTGVRLSGAVCGGWFKGNTIRFD